MIPNTTMLAGGIGAVVALVLLFALGAEKNAHAMTRQALADEMQLVAALQIQQATIAGQRATAVSEALAAQQADLDRQLENEQRLRTQLAEAEDLRESDARSADAKLVRLKNENEKLREWSATGVPDNIVEWVLESAADEATAASP